MSNPNAADPRLIVMTDISDTEPDDKESMVRLMAYSNEFDIEGLIATSAYWRVLNKNSIAPEKITEIIAAYAKVRDNLLKHAQGYPTAEYLHDQVKKGNGHAMEAVGNGKNTPGSDQIAAAMEKDDSRPLWVTIWGGASTLAQALWDLKAEHESNQMKRMVDNLRVYDIAGQDNAGAWICHNFPGVFYIRSVEQFSGMTFNQAGRNPHTRGGDETVATRQWIRRNIQDNHGALGLVYPDCKWIHEGDTPSYMYLMQNGLGDPQKPWYGCWGGRFTKDMQKNVACRTPKQNEALYHDYHMHCDAVDQWDYEGREYSNVFCSLFR